MDNPLLSVVLSVSAMSFAAGGPGCSSANEGVAQNSTAGSSAGGSSGSSAGGSSANGGTATGGTGTGGSSASGGTASGGTGTGGSGTGGTGVLDLDGSVQKTPVRSLKSLVSMTFYERTGGDAP